MNDEQRAALVDAFTQVVFNLESPDYYWHLQPAEDQYRTRRYAEELFDDTLAPIIDHLLAERDIDAMLDAVHPRARVLHLSQVEVEQWYVEIGWTTSDYSSIPAVYTNREVVGYGPTRTAAIADACKRALEGRGDE